MAYKEFLKTGNPAKETVVDCSTKRDLSLKLFSPETQIYPYTHILTYSYTHISSNSKKHILIYSYTHMHSYTHKLMYTYRDRSQILSEATWGGGAGKS